MTYLQKRFSSKHFHKYFVDNDTKEAVCLCGKVRGAEKKNSLIPKESKYHNKTSIYNGYGYDSMKEAQYAMYLDYQIKNKEIKNWERQYPIHVIANGIKLFTMKVDFLVHHNDGSKELREVKGYETDIFRLKKKCLDAIWLPVNSEFTYTLIK